MLRLDDLTVFVRTADRGSLSAAAVQLGSTQPTISRRLQWLEKLLGLRLLQRSTHAMKLTADGERCYAHAKALLESWAAVEADLRGAKDQPRGHLRVLAPHAFGQELLVALALNVSHAQHATIAGAATVAVDLGSVYLAKRQLQGVGVS